MPNGRRRTTPMLYTEMIVGKRLVTPAPTADIGSADPNLDRTLTQMTLMLVLPPTPTYRPAQAARAIAALRS